MHAQKGEQKNAFNERREYGVTCYVKRCVNMWTVCAQPDGSMSSLLQSTGSSLYVLVHIVGPLASTYERQDMPLQMKEWLECFMSRPIKRQRDTWGLLNDLQLSKSLIADKTQRCRWFYNEYSPYNQNFRFLFFSFQCRDIKTTLICEFCPVGWHAQKSRVECNFHWKACFANIEIQCIYYRKTRLEKYWIIPSKTPNFIR